MAIEAVLPLKVTGSYGGDDLNRAHILFHSLRRFAAPGLFDRIHVVVPEPEVAQVTAALARWRDLNVAVVSEHAVVPEMSAYPRMRGWRKQQIVKLAIARRVQSRFYLTFDADVICLRPIGAAQLIVDGRALMQYERRAQHPKWWKSSARLLRMNPNVGDPAVGATVTPALLARDICLAVMDELDPRRNGKNWVDTLGSLHRPWNPRNWWVGNLLKNKWTEYSLYYLCAHKRAMIDRYHVTAGTPAVPQLLLVNDALPYDTWDVARSFSPGHTGLFLVVGSKLGVPPADVWTKVGPYLDPAHQHRLSAAHPH